ncbi:carbohydrate ABC transporter permease [Microbacterium sp. zg-Y818]|uniref:carbohydrate ABC transporter permease n=1 Tax=unclassified Microbacterium TaxID=2609290 RepID=UPI00214BCD0B|nr:MULTISPECIES: carbohydrate ABC transporter permease [unclassified Microbacterium]MCR2802029.1 carbohydrate ABC transporter permease [Microbacterium sp. zg.Y818]WIM22581.1 carbohydrate ABC transporter permease [Microbacterium sp. zg-Y818]
MNDTRPLGRITISVLVALVLVVQLVPFYVTLTTALKPRTDRSSSWLFPQGEIAWENFATAIEDGHVLTAIMNTAIVTVVSTVLICVIAAAAAYPLARRTTIGNKMLLLGIVGLMMIPPLATLVPLYTLLRDMGALNTYWGLILVMVAGGLPLAIFLYAAFMRSLPISMEEAARVDGASQIQVLWQIVVPTLKPVTATVIILSSVGVWNEFALSNFILAKPDTRMIAPSISTFFSASGSNFGAAAAASLLAVLPVLIAYLFLQRQFIAGMVAGSEK